MSSLFVPTWRVRRGEAGGPLDSGYTPGVNPDNPEKPPSPPLSGLSGCPQSECPKSTAGSGVALTPYERLESDGYLTVRSSVLGGKVVLFVLDPTRVPTDLRHLPSFGMTEIEKLLTLPRDAAQEALRALDLVKATLGPRSRLTGVSAAPEPPAAPEEARP